MRRALRIIFATFISFSLVCQQAYAQAPSAPSQSSLLPWGMLFHEGAKLLRRNPRAAVVAGEAAGGFALRHPLAAAALAPAAIAGAGLLAAMNAHKGQQGGAGGSQGGQGRLSPNQLRAQQNAGDPDDDDPRINGSNRGDRTQNRRTGDSKQAEKKRVDDAARIAGIDRNEFGDYVEAQKDFDRLGSNENYTMKELLELAGKFKNGE